MDMYAAGLTPVFFPVAKGLVMGHRNEDAFYAAYGCSMTPAWIGRLAAILLRPQRIDRPVDTIAMQAA